MQFTAALSTMFDHIIDANDKLRQQLVELKANCDRLAADRSDALKVMLSVHLLPGLYAVVTSSQCIFKLNKNYLFIIVCFGIILKWNEHEWMGW